ncbi:hypothetical protein CONCODRAFT_16087 [Conidiobolus coronatus NRRL 28638]|uniref:Uncharacterized protein n=1 Tax=Conidiobolus coronatus (strain ATCC 28846 / CBS 209.66 / NRRL 28638) TaxID=796925 RepID=A0A137PC24_CONC2|nr:hypothetical protein CONCODRAFT_16087 [Conidiobolus coronatus NRRL 28638]|eukprot:KXN72549.1 hypothetical protein CONCODRAFT_16087 [Conidiobolus coronatus NRRL 28638]
MNPFVRIATQLATKYITEALLRSPAFHRFAGHTHRKINEFSQKGNEYINNADNIKQLNNRWDVFKREFNKNIEKEINNLKK